ncbi:MAG: FAD/NAD(P)-binding protein [Bryobacteraceae bacterium]|nr:FAD/NAD(P)-binding protein [Bryobacteraceae bacterium]
MLPQASRVIAVERETRDTFTFTVAAPGGGSGFAPGQFSMLSVFGVGEAPISISGDPGEPDRLVYTVRSVGPVTQALVTRRPGEWIGVRGPFGASWPLAALRGKDILIVAGGIGLAPLRPAVYYVLRRRGDYGRLVLLYGARSPQDMLYRKQLSAWSYLPDTQILTTVDYGGLSWRGHVGVVTTLFRYARFDAQRTAALVCGPEVMMRFVLRELETRGMALSDVYVSMERNMKCAVGFCGHCQLGPHFVCKDGPVFPAARVKRLMERYEL